MRNKRLVATNHDCVLARRKKVNFVSQASNTDRLGVSKEVSFKGSFPFEWSIVFTYFLFDKTISNPTNGLNVFRESTQFFT